MAEPSRSSSRFAVLAVIEIADGPLHRLNANTGLIYRPIILPSNPASTLFTRRFYVELS